MDKVLYIKANIKPKGESKTFRISDSFVETYKQCHPEDEIITLDLYEEGFQPLSVDDLTAITARKTEESKKDPVLKYAYQFAEADKYIIAAPMWNLGLPAIVKAYIDYTCISGIAFKYTEQGPVGLLPGKKVTFITTRGGIYSTEPFLSREMGEQYLRTLFEVFGITDFTTIAAEQVDVIGNDVETIIGNAIKDAQQKAKNF